MTSVFLELRSAIYGHVTRPALGSRLTNKYSPKPGYSKQEMKTAAILLLAGYCIDIQLRAANCNGRSDQVFRLDTQDIRDDRAGR